MTTYRITYLAGKLDISICPPVIVKEIFPAYNGEPLTLDETECIVTFKKPQTPVDLGPLVKIEIL